MMPSDHGSANQPNQPDQPAQPSFPAVIEFLTGPLRGRLYTIEQATTSIGRDPANDVAVPDDPKVSRRHARLIWQKPVWHIENSSQSSFIRVDGRITQESPLSDGTTVHLGDDSSFIFRLPARKATPQDPDIVTAQRPDVVVPTHHNERASASEGYREPQHVGPLVAVDERAPTSGRPKTHPDETQLASLSMLGMPSLEVTSTANGEKRVHLLTAAVTNIGRDASNDIVIPDRIISGQHLRVVRHGASFVLIHPCPERPRTLNGLLYQGRKIRGDESFTKPLANGDIFRIGDDDGALVTLTYRDGSAAPSPALPPVAPIKLDAAEFTIGRAATNTVVLNHQQVSSHHARLTREGAAYRISDLHSTNHVYVNGEVIGQSGTLLKTGDEIRIGPYRFVHEKHQLSQYDESTFTRIDALGLQSYGVNRVTLLDDITLTIPPRAFVALVGGSGAGKSTLLDALNGLRPAQQGRVFYNGQDYYANLAAFSSQLGYVPQDDIVHRDLTVERALYYVARMRLPSDYSDEQIQQRIGEVLEEVELTGRRTLLVRKLSGGQRKRVSIALELLANPGVFFLDEPTSGLDPGLDRKMMTLLRRLADRGHTVVLVTHATNNINACDYVCFLCAGGRLAYFGPPEQAKSYFGKTDFAEIYSSLEPTEEQPHIPEAAEARFRASPEYQQYVAGPLQQGPPAATATFAALGAAVPARERVSSSAGGGVAAPKRAERRRWAGWERGWRQFRLLSLRYLELLINDRVNLLILLFQAPVIAVMLVLMLRFEIGAGIFSADTLVQCRTQLITANGVLTLPQAQHAELIGCQQVRTFLQHTTSGQAFAHQNGGTSQALQAFIVPGLGADAQKALFIMAFATILFGCINGAREFVKEAAIYRRERAVNLGILPYMFSKIAVLGLLCLFQSAVLTGIVELGEPLHQGIMLSPVAETYITLALTSLAGLMIGLTISAVAPNTDRAISIVPLVLLPQVIFSGAIIPLKDWGTQILATVFPARWAMAALGSSIGLHAETVGGDRLFGNDYSYHATLFSIYSQADAVHRLLLSWGALLALSVILMVCIGVSLKRKDTQS